MLIYYDIDTVCKFLGVVHFDKQPNDTLTTVKWLKNDEKWDDLSSDWLSCCFLVHCLEETVAEPNVVAVLGLLEHVFPNSNSLISHIFGEQTL